MAVPLKDETINFTGCSRQSFRSMAFFSACRTPASAAASFFVVDHSGHIVAHPDTQAIRARRGRQQQSPSSRKSRRFRRILRTTETLRFSEATVRNIREMVGTYSTIPDLNWAVVAQRSLDKRERCRRHGAQRQALKFVIVVIACRAILVGYFFAVGISTPIRGLAASTLAISRGEFHQRTPVQGAAEISELAETFNNMAGDIEEFIEQLKQAAEENHELFLGSIRMLAAAIDEKDPYTRGHSGRVAKYSTLIAQQLGLASAELDKIRISALLHDVGKIGVDDRVLKKPGALTPEEFGLMKQHPVKGANIMRPVAQLKEMLPGIELHHEHVDGRGYPARFARAEIPLMARIIAVADTLDAMTTNRPYQSAMDLEFAMNRIRALTGTKFDAVVVNALESAVTAGKLRLSAVEVHV